MLIHDVDRETLPAKTIAHADELEAISGWNIRQMQAPRMVFRELLLGDAPIEGCRNPLKREALRVIDSELGRKNRRRQTRRPVHNNAAQTSGQKGGEG